MKDVAAAPGEDCTQCGHPFDDHQLITTTGDPLDGGVVVCPVTSCRCYGTWDVPQADEIREKYGDDIGRKKPQGEET